MKKLVANWHEKYRTKMSLVDAMITDLKSMPSETENVRRFLWRFVSSFAQLRDSNVHFEFLRALGTFKVIFESY